ncbi:MAG: SIS domain-containing protein [Chloroflexi bacterium]|nr:MAG: SIS domain-containing protein [Chloroflexota bacterium]
MDHMNVLIERYPDLLPCIQDIRDAYQFLFDCYQNGGKVLVCGNGGSASDSEHIVGELMKGFSLKRPLPPDLQEKFKQAYGEDGVFIAERLQGGLPAISLVSQISLLTAFANDVSADLIFAQQVYAYGKPGDVLIAISTSGRAKNIITALQVAKIVGLRTVGLTARDGGEMPPYCDTAIRVPAHSTASAQERHLPIYHTLCAMLEEAFFST